MRILAILLILMISFYQCKDKPNKGNKQSVTSKIDPGSISGELYSKLLEYQKKYPPSKSSAKNVLYVYEVFFKKQLPSDTILLISRSSEGVIANESEVVFGIYQDKNLLPTIVRDSKEFYSKNFLINTIRDSIQLQKFRPIAGKNYPESYPPVYTYTIKGRELLLKSVDTVWSIWE